MKSGAAESLVYLQKMSRLEISVEQRGFEDRVVSRQLQHLVFVSQVMVLARKGTNLRRESSEQLLIISV